MVGAFGEVQVMDWGSPRCPAPPLVDTSRPGGDVGEDEVAACATATGRSRRRAACWHAGVHAAGAGRRAVGKVDARPRRVRAGGGAGGDPHRPAAVRGGARPRRCGSSCAGEAGRLLRPAGRLRRHPELVALCSAAPARRAVGSPPARAAAGVGRTADGGRRAGTASGAGPGAAEGEKVAAQLQAAEQKEAARACNLALSAALGRAPWARRSPGWSGAEAQAVRVAARAQRGPGGPAGPVRGALAAATCAGRLPPWRRPRSGRRRRGGRVAARPAPAADLALPATSTLSIGFSGRWSTAMPGHCGGGGALPGALGGQGGPRRGATR